MRMTDRENAKMEKALAKEWDIYWAGIRKFYSQGLKRGELECVRAVAYLGFGAGFRNGYEVKGKKK